MQSLPDRLNHNSTPNPASQQLENPTLISASPASTTSAFQPYKPPLHQRGLTQTAIWMVLILLAGIGFAAVTVWMFLPSMLPKLPLTFL